MYMYIYIYLLYYFVQGHQKAVCFDWINSHCCVCPTLGQHQSSSNEIQICTSVALHSTHFLRRHARPRDAPKHMTCPPSRTHQTSQHFRPVLGTSVLEVSRNILKGNLNKGLHWKQRGHRIYIRSVQLCAFLIQSCQVHHWVLTRRNCMNGASLGFGHLNSKTKLFRVEMSKAISSGFWMRKTSPAGSVFRSRKANASSKCSLQQVCMYYE